MQVFIVRCQETRVRVFGRLPKVSFFIENARLCFISTLLINFWTRTSKNHQILENFQWLRKLGGFPEECSQLTDLNSEGSPSQVIS